ncbi:MULTISPECIES: hypothetical protein [Sorangium]|uniref:hypothetical protein n=1 Tax=Sorangium TaxID=39643 RepID=UPI00101A054C|nr:MULTISPECIES: hypothetical protein [Sorangium]
MDWPTPPVRPKGQGGRSSATDAESAVAALAVSLLGVLPDGIARSDLAAFVNGLGSSMASRVAEVRLATFAGDRVRMPALVRAYVAAAFPPSTEEAMDRYGRLAEELGPLADRQRPPPPRRHRGPARQPARAPDAAAAPWRSIGRVDLVAIIDRELAGAGKPR